MRIPLIVVAAFVMTTSVATAQQVIPSGGEEDVRLYNRSPFDAAMVTLEYRGGEDMIAPPLLLRIEPGQEIVMDQVLAIADGAAIQVGSPLVPGATVTVTVVAHGKHDKVRIFKMRRRKHYQKRQGHRQQFTELQIGAIAA